MMSRESPGATKEAVIDEIQSRWPSWFKSDPPELEWALKSTARIEAQVSVVLYAFEPGTADPILVAKVSRDPEFSTVIATEFEKIREARSLMGPLGSETIPEALDIVTVGADVYLISRYAREDRRWDGEPESARVETADRLAAWLAQLHSASERPKASQPAFADRVSAAFMEAFGVNDPTAIRALEEAEHLLMEECRSARSESLVHGDFWPGNWRLLGDGFEVIDWELAHWSSSPVIDEFLFPLSESVEGKGRGGAFGHPDVRWWSDVYRAHRGLPCRNDEEARLAAAWCAAEVATRPFRRWGVVEDWSVRWRDEFLRLVGGRF